MIYTVTLNPAVDCSIKLNGYCTGTVNRAESEMLSAGGKGINMSIILSRLGIETMALGFCGGDTGKLFCRLLDSAGCPYRLTELDGKSTRINVKINDGNSETEINGKGPEISREELADFMDMLEKVLKPDDTLILAGSVPPSVPRSIYADIMRRLSGKNIRIAADTSGRLLEELLDMRPFLIKPNNFELGELCGMEINTHDEAFEGAEILQRKGARNVLVSLAGEGAVLLCEDGTKYSMNPPSGIVKNSVGAGDSMLAGFLAGLEMYNDYRIALALGTAAGSATVFSEFLAKKNEIEAVFHEFYPDLTIGYNQ